MRLLIAAAAFAAVPGAAQAQELRDFCADRPGLGTPACTLDRGHLAAELGLIGWTLDRQAGDREDEISTGDLLVRYGITDSTEVQLGWTAYTHIRARSGGLVERESGTGDVLVALRQNLHNPDGSGFSAAIMPYVTLPAGSDGIGAGDWGAGVIVPLSQELAGGFSLAATFSAAAQPDEDGDGRHFAYGGIIGLDIPISDAVGAGVELSATRDRDPAGSSTELLADVSFSWMANDDLQFDVGADFGLNRSSPDFALSLGVAKRF